VAWSGGNGWYGMRAPWIETPAGAIARNSDSGPRSACCMSTPMRARQPQPSGCHMAPPAQSLCGPATDDGSILPPARRIPMLRLTLAAGHYDRTEALRDGRVRAEGVALTYLMLPVEEIFWRMAQYREFDAAEFSLGGYLVRRGRGADDLIAIPV